MNTPDFILHKTELMSELTGFYRKAIDIGDQERADKILKLAEKLYREEIVIAFCGHFSAGKSAMINHLTGEVILPSSPIPTSANLVALHAGDEKPVRVTLADDQIYELEPPLDEKAIIKLGKEGLKIKRIDIWKNSESMPEGVTLLDTPGIDSVDDAHKRSTESAVHLADLLFYVMDYNHVQSEMNFEYIKNMSQHNRKIYAVINQIDKHRDEELTLSTFKNSVEKAFYQWGASPEKFFYTSLKYPDHGENQSQQLKDEISQMTRNKKKLLVDSVSSSLDVLTSEMRSYLEDELEDITDAYSTIIDEKDVENKESLYHQAESISEQDVYSLNEWSESFDNEMNKMLKASYLMPSEVRTKAEYYLEAMQKDFKKGLLFSGKKTQQERENRENDFKKSLIVVIDEQLIWHSKSLIYRFLENAGTDRSDWSGIIEKISVDDPVSFIRRNVKSGAGFTGEALLNYCESLAEDVRREIKSQMLHIKNEMIQTLDDVIEENTVRRSAEHDAIMKKVNVLKQLERLEKQLHELEEIKPDQDLEDKWVGNWSEEEKSFETISRLDGVLTETDQENAAPETSYHLNSSDIDEIQLFQNSQQLAHEISNIKGFEQQSNILFEQSERLKNKKYTVALFGAFSAGKSSFANALLGHKVLPVSPNPTTASINRIFPPDTENPDQTVIVHFKQESELLMDLQEASQLKNIQTLSEMNEKLPDVLKKNHDLTESRKSFIRAFLEGWPDYRNDLGNKKSVAYEEFQGFVSNEHQSCFVEAIDLYASSSVSEQGITLVDTPGADSVNARHTDVSFDYIRNSDAILFVTYFNHAFARADREFLIQMGRVKESFEHDKMFFVVNAVDLAENEDEKNDVIHYVKTQLKSFGISHPKIFGVSSLNALKQKRNSGLQEFEDEFTAFIDQELDSIVKKNTADYYEQTINRMTALLEQSRANEQDKERRKAALEQLAEELDSHFEASNLQAVEAQASQELKELLYYVNQRVFYRFSDFFKEAFNPAGFHGQSNKVALKQAVDELITMLSFDFSQEFKVVNYRLEQLIFQSFKTELNQKWDEIRKVFPEGIKPDTEIAPADLLTFNYTFEQLNELDFSNEKSIFKNTKSFFEKNEKKLMQHALEEKLKKVAITELEEVSNQLTFWMTNEMKRVQSILYDRWQKELSSQIDSAITNLNSEEYATELEKALKSVNAYAS
ncbi:dynamin family protein [Jeotgalibacillus salarius]|uniref:Dynamin N-terminal domain-containing protein n=1 Tax=Jeotgalibacillus salarius TaxID=546023 RepID=A0A4Y8LKV6_9BACL|nr:dynamin family protein [Jeotgalibacillus salarius]TFE03039.1 hypothetical protein E2626_04295 [Jeotgalibacillus salarius]